MDLSAFVGGMIACSIGYGTYWLSHRSDRQLGHEKPLTTHDCQELIQRLRIEANDDIANEVQSAFLRFASIYAHAAADSKKYQCALETIATMSQYGAPHRVALQALDRRRD